MSPAAEAQAWGMVFESRHDFFGDLLDLGVPVNRLGDPDREAAEEAWHRLGATYLAHRDPGEIGTPWALTEFGEPHAG